MMNIAAGAEEAASSTSHTSSSRQPVGQQARLQYQPLTMADALARAGHDETRALDELLAERNKYCLEAGKLSTENVRLWSLMKRIRRENDEHKTSLAQSKISPPTFSSPLANVTTLSSSSASMVGEPSSTEPRNGVTLDTTPELLSSSQATIGSTHIPKASIPTNDVRLASPTSSKTMTSYVSTQDGIAEQSQLGSTSASGTPSQLSDSIAHSAHHQQSIIQQRAAAQEQRARQLLDQERRVRPGSMESHEFEAVEGSSAAPSEGYQSGRPSISQENESENNSLSRGVRSMDVTSDASSPLHGSANAWSSSPRVSRDSPRSLFSPRLDAGLLPFVSLALTGSNLHPNERGKEIISFFINVDVRPPAGRNAPPSSWRIEKSYSDFVAIDARIRQKHGKLASKALIDAILPDKALFKDHAPSKVDVRKAILGKYLQTLLEAPLPDKDDLCTFLCTDTTPSKVSNPDSLSKDGFLTKKGQNLGRWVTRWYVLSNLLFEYYEWRGGPHLGSINIRGAQIGRQQKSTATDTDENSYRHAFLILESKPSMSPSEQKQIIRHVLCAESDEERDEWVDVLVRAIGEAEEQDQADNTVVLEDQSPQQDPDSIVSDVRVASQENGREGFSPIVPVQGANVQQLSQSSSHTRHAVPLPNPPIVSQSTNANFADEHPLQPSEPRPTPSILSRGPTVPSGTATFPEPLSGSKAFSPRARGTPPPPPLSPTSSVSFQQQQSQAPRFPPRSTSQEVSRSSVQSRPSQEVGLVRSPSPDSSLRHSGAVSSKDRIRPSISGPMNGTLIPTGYKFGAKEDNTGITSSGSDTKKRFWHRFGGGNDKNQGSKKVFGVPLAETLAVSNAAESLELPSVVYRCIEYLEHRNAAREEGIYRLSGSSAVIKSLKDRFNMQGDVNLLASSEPFYDPHAIAGLLKQFLRELPSSVLTRELHLDFMRVNDILDRKERVNELGSLVSMLPLSNYSLLRTLCSHLIKVIELSDVNKMTMRNVGIVFSPTLGIPAGVFALFLTEFDWVFYTDAKGEPAPKTMEEDILPPDANELGVALPSANDQESSSSPSNPASQQPTSFARNNRNSLRYNDVEADRLLGGPQGRNRLSSQHEDFGAYADPNTEYEATTASTDREEYNAPDSAHEPQHDSHQAPMAPGEAPSSVSTLFSNDARAVEMEVTNVAPAGQMSSSSSHTPRNRWTNLSRK